MENIASHNREIDWPQCTGLFRRVAAASAEPGRSS
jgi:hypothetical protein